MVAPSCSLLHCPIDLDNEPALDAELKGWMAFAKQKLQEVAILARAVERRPGGGGRRAGGQPGGRREPQPVAAHPQPGRASSAWPASTRRCSAAGIRFAQRREAQRRRLALPLLPTTTIGSFPQTGEVRKARAALEEGRVVAGAVRGVLPAGDRADRPLPGGDRARRAGPRRVRADRHGRVLRRAAGGLRLHAATAGCRATARAA